MKTIIINIFAVFLGIFIGAATNGGIINISSKIIPPPPGVYLQTLEGWIQAMPIIEPKHFIIPFLAHGIGTLVGVIVCNLLTRSHHLLFALSIGLSFFIGGLIMALQLPAPIWFEIVDLTLAYFPMAILGQIISKKIRQVISIK